MNKIATFVLFLTINFSALGIGSWLMNGGPQSEWYQHLNKAPWTPDGWVFGVAWSSIMICFAIYMTYLYHTSPTRQVISLYGIQVFLNIIWNYLFFNQQLIKLSVISLVLLTLVVGLIFVSNLRRLSYKSILIMPYLIWLGLAISLNAYITVTN